MSNNQWTAELWPDVEFPDSPGDTVWHAVAPWTYPLMGHPSRYPFHQTLEDVRRAYPLASRAAAEDAARRANTYKGP